MQKRFSSRNVLESPSLKLHSLEGNQFAKWYSLSRAEALLTKSVFMAIHFLSFFFFNYTSVHFGFRVVRQTSGNYGNNNKNMGRPTVWQHSKWCDGCNIRHTKCPQWERKRKTKKWEKSLRLFWGVSSSSYWWMTLRSFIPWGFGRGGGGINGVKGSNVWGKCFQDITLFQLLSNTSLNAQMYVLIFLWF